MYFSFLVLSVHHARQVEQLGALVDLRPEPLLHLLLDLLQPGLVLERVQMRQNAHDTRKPVNLLEVRNSISNLREFLYGRQSFFYSFCFNQAAQIHSYGKLIRLVLYVGPVLRLTQSRYKEGKKPSTGDIRTIPF